MTYRRASTAISQTQLSVVAASPSIIASAAAAAAAITSRQQFTAHGPPTQYSFVRSFKRKYWREIGVYDSDCCGQSHAPCHMQCWV